ncbi:hypothetical protein [Parashewanella tropica]|uniref:hypothetical protein n=1 Tax=Parashewanella tropica TaxID=2547970 RepID=UPI00105A6BAC|nr:hypothetical protein [Parashewanella tropica]
MITLPEKYQSAHDLCFILHDIMTQIIVSGEKADAFTTHVKLSEEEIESISDEEHILDWLKRNDKVEDKNQIISSTVLPAILSDMMHCIYEALSSASKGKMSVAYMLIRKPIQESLFVLEEMYLDRDAFVGNLESNQSRLQPKITGGIDGHKKRISQVLESLKFNGVLDSNYIAQLRYDKSSNDSFDGICNKAMHLFTGHHSIKTEDSNINFIFSGVKGLPSQWKYFYSRLPYLLFYIYLIVENVLERIAPTSEQYILDMMRRISAQFILASHDIEERYATDENGELVFSLSAWLLEHCTENGYPDPEHSDLIQMAKTGCFPKEAQESIDKRIASYSAVQDVV